MKYCGNKLKKWRFGVGVAHALKRVHGFMVMGAKKFNGKTKNEWPLENVEFYKVVMIGT